LFKVTENTLRVLAIELINASQAIYFREPLRTSSLIDGFLADFRKTVPIIKEDKIMSDEIQKAEKFLKEYQFALPA
jgi:histidine ammonia-lyase